MKYVGLRLFHAIFIAILTVAGFFAYRSAFAQVSCTNPSPLPSGYAVPCPILAVYPSGAPPALAMGAIAAPPTGTTTYIYTTAYLYNGSNWIPETLIGSSPYAGYANTAASLYIPNTLLSTLPTLVYLVEWDWTWNAASNCYFGPGSMVCSQGKWRLQEFNRLATSPTSSPTPTTVTYTGKVSSLMTGGFQMLNSACGTQYVYTTANTIFIPNGYSPRVSDSVSVVTGSGALLCALQLNALQVTLNAAASPSPSAS